MKKKYVAMVILFIFMLGGCKKKQDVKIDPTETGSDKKMYDTAVKQITRDPEKARLLFKEIMQLYPDSVYATRSKLGIADSYFKEKDSASMILAASEYQEFVSLFPYSPDAVYAKYQIGICYYRQVKSPGRDQTNTFAAVKAFEQMIQQYPDTKQAEEAKKKIAECRQILATHFFRIGYYNFLLGTVPGALERFKQVIDEYPDFKQNDKLFFYIGKAYYAIKAYDSAISFFQRVVTGFPKSSFVGKSKRMIKSIQAIIDKMPKKAPSKEETK